MESEAYSPGQEYFNPSYNSDMDFKQEYVDMKEEKYSPEHQDGDGYNQGYHGEEYEDQMQGGHPPPYGGPPRGGGGGHPYGPPRGKFNGPRNNGPRGGPRGNFNNGNDFMQN